MWLVMAGFFAVTGLLLRLCLLVPDKWLVERLRFASVKWLAWKIVSKMTCNVLNKWSRVRLAISCCLTIVSKLFVHLPPSLGSKIYYQPKGGDASWQGRWLPSFCFALPRHHRYISVTGTNTRLRTRNSVVAGAKVVTVCRLICNSTHSQ